MSTKSVICTFVGQQLLQSNQGVKSCSIKYGRCQQPLTVDAQNHSVEANTDSVHLSLLTELKSGDCYFLNASSGTFTVLQWGLYSSSVATYFLSPLAHIVPLLFMGSLLY